MPLKDFPNSKLATPTNIDVPIVMLRHDRAVFTLKNYAWMAGASADLDSNSARVLRDALDSSINLASVLTAIIFDTGASISISNNAADFPDGLEPCDAELQA